MQQPIPTHQKYRTLISTQCLENYGAHTENGKFEDGNAYWKFKGGDRYIISTNSSQVANAVAFLSAYLHKNQDVYGKEIIVDHEVICDDWESEEEGWDPIEIDIEEYFEILKRIKKKRAAGGEISVDRSPAGVFRGALSRAING